MLYGTRVTLRATERSDLEQLWRFNNDVEVELAGGGDPPMPQSQARAIAEYEADAAKGGRDGASFAIEADGKCIGRCALFNFDPLAHTCELGITIGDKAYWGGGYGTEAISMLVDYGFRMRNLSRLFLRVHSVNLRAQGAYRKCGFVEEGRLRKHVYSNGEYDDLILMGILRSEWQQSRAQSDPATP